MDVAGRTGVAADQCVTSGCVEGEALGDTGGLALEAHLGLLICGQRDGATDIDPGRRLAGMWSTSRRRLVLFSHSTRCPGSPFLIQLTMETCTTASPDQGWEDTASVMTPPWSVT